jgi:hypothetical protein
MMMAILALLLSVWYGSFIVAVVRYWGYSDSGGDLLAAMTLVLPGYIAQYIVGNTIAVWCVFAAPIGFILCSVSMLLLEGSNDSTYTA